MFRYLLWVTVTFGGLMIVVSALFDYWNYHNFRFERLLFPLVVYPIAGFFIGLFGWLDNERKYDRGNADR